ncbi:MAG TPA: ribonuclease P protein component [Stellaceae bacterium]|nr:ribonuclease P protein component [Stellaceae bacterium]
MPALERLRRRSDFLRVAAGRRKWVAPGLILQTLASIPEADGAPAPAPEAIRVGFTATRKIGNAVIRNRARRRLKAAAAAVMPLHARPGFDYVLIARAETPKRIYGALLADLETALRRLGTWREEAPEQGERNPC